VVEGTKRCARERVADFPFGSSNEFIVGWAKDLLGNGSRAFVVGLEEQTCPITPPFSRRRPTNSFGIRGKSIDGAWENVPARSDEPIGRAGFLSSGHRFSVISLPT
jgi:hypothetical protein